VGPRGAAIVGLIFSIACGVPTHSTDTDGALAPLDESRLDRAADCLLGGAECGYPSEGPNGYGTEIGDRMENFALVDCAGNQREFAEYFQANENGDRNRAVLFSLGAGWCEPCKEETEELPGVLDDYRSRGFDVVQVLFQDWMSAAPTRMFCDEWVAEYGLDHVVLLDQTWTFYPTYLQDVMASTPVTILTDANGTIRYKLEGQKPPNLGLEIEQILAEPYGD
jgi:thiol-disulfide isomerase/thioredoxin